MEYRYSNFPQTASNYRLVKALCIVHINLFTNQIFQAWLYILPTWYIVQDHPFETSKLFHWFHPFAQVLQASLIEVCNFGKKIVTFIFISLKPFNCQGQKVFILSFFKQLMILMNQIFCEPFL